MLLARIENLLRQRQLLKNLYQGAQEAEKEISESHLEDRDKQFLKQLQAIIQQNLSDSEFGVEDMGQQIGLSRVQLYRKVKAMTGSSVVDLLRKARLAKAKRLLETRSMSVSEVAYDVGFSAPSDAEAFAELSTISTSLWITCESPSCSRGITTIKSEPFPGSLSTLASP